MGNFVHLHVHTDFSLCDSMAQIPVLVGRAKELGFTALAITDHGNMFGVLNFEQQCKDAGIKPIIGCEFYVAAESRLIRQRVANQKNYHHLILLAKNSQGYKNLCKLSSLAYTEGFYSRPRIDEEVMEQYSEGLICLSACIAGKIPSLLLEGKTPEAEETALKYQQIYGKENFFIELQKHGIADEDRVMPMLVELAKKHDIPLVVTNDVHYVMDDDAVAHDVLLCIGRKEELNSPNHKGYDGSGYYLKSGEEMAELFPEYPEAVSNTGKIAEMCDDCVIKKYKTQELKDCLPIYQIPEGFETQDDYVRHLVEEGLVRRYGEITPQLRERAEMELNTIFTMGFSGYFLIVWDFINWAKKNDIPIGPGRGSGAGSLVAYAMTITDIDPMEYGLLFERFLNPERISMPDFDIDMCEEGRKDIIEYTRQKYGHDQVANIVTFSTEQPKAIIADVGRVLNIPLSEVTEIKSKIPKMPSKKFTLSAALEPPTDKVPDGGCLMEYKNNPKYNDLFKLAIKLEGCHRNTSLHASGIVIGRTSLPDWAPVCAVKSQGKNADNVTAVQYTMDVIEQIGLVKMDYLGLKTLTLIKRAEKLIRRRPGYENFSAQKILDRDEKTFQLFCHGDTVGVFQFESAGMQKYLKQLHPNSVSELVAMNALYRPGPMDFIPQYIDGKFNPKTVRYPHESLKDILEETNGVMVYQEQVMLTAQRIAGYSLGEADLLRRAMGKKKPEVMAAEKGKFIPKAKSCNFDEKKADEIFEIMEKFAGYGFNKSHAAAYAFVAYQTAYLKAHFAPEFYVANLINESRNKAEDIGIFVTDAKRHDISILPPDINKSENFFSGSEGNVVFGFCGIKDVGEEIGIQITEERSANGKFTSFMNFLERMTGYVNKKNMESLIYSGAFDSVSNEQSPNRTSLAVNLDRALEYAKARSAVGESLFGEGANLFEEFKFDIVPELPKEEILNKENELCGFFFSGHPYDEMRDRIMEVGELNISLLTKELGNEEDDADFTYRENTVYTFAGKIVDFMPITTKKGENMAKITVEDFLGKIKVVFFPKVWEELKGNISIGDYVGVHVTINFSDQGNIPEMLGLSLFSLNGSVPPKPEPQGFYRKTVTKPIEKNKSAEPLNDEMRERIEEVEDLDISVLMEEFNNKEGKTDFTYQENTVYTLAGKIVDFASFTTKKGEEMAKITLEDFSGELTVVFFPRVWKKQKSNISIGDYVGVHGTINFSDQGNGPEMVGLSLFPLDGSVPPKPNARRQVPQWIIDKNKPAEPPKPALPPAKKVHIMLRDGFLRDEELQPLRDTICEAANGRGEVLFHIDSINATFKAADCFKITYDDETIEKIQKSPYVEKVWLE